MFTCPICGKDMLIEDGRECDKCHKTVCVDCITNQTTAPDDASLICKKCMEVAHDNT